MAKTHELKTWPEYYQAVKSGNKTFEVRKNDRDFQVGDKLFLKEYDPDKGELTGDFNKCEITYILHGGNFGIEYGYCILGIKPFEWNY